MPAIETQSRHQHAVLWAFSDYDSHGQPTLSDPVEIDVRWEFVSRASQDPEGHTDPYDAVVFVNRVIAVGSVLWLGKLVDLPSPTVDLYRVVSYEAIPDIKGRVTQRTVLAVKLGDTLPTVV